MKIGDSPGDFVGHTVTIARRVSENAGLSVSHVKLHGPTISCSSLHINTCAPSECIATERM